MSASSAGSAARKDYGKNWLILSDDARFTADALRATYVALLRRANDKVEIEPMITVFDAIERDVARTFASGGGFETQQARNRLRRILACYAMHDPETRYTQGMNFLAGFILAHTPRDEDAFVLFTRLLQHPRYAMRGCFMNGLPDVEVYNSVLMQLLQEHVPGLAAHFSRVGVEPLFFFEWWFTLFCLVLPPHTVADIWTLFFADGWTAVFKTMLVLMAHLEPHVAGKDFNGTIVALKGYQNRRNELDFPELSGLSGTSGSGSTGSSSSSAGSSSAAAGSGSGAGGVGSGADSRAAAHGGAGAGSGASRPSPPASTAAPASASPFSSNADASAAGAAVSGSALSFLGDKAGRLFAGALATATDIGGRLGATLAAYPPTAAVAARLGIGPDHMSLADSPASAGRDGSAASGSLPAAGTGVAPADRSGLRSSPTPAASPSSDGSAGGWVHVPPQGGPASLTGGGAERVFVLDPPSDLLERVRALRLERSHVDSLTGAARARIAEARRVAEAEALLRATLRGGV